MKELELYIDNIQQMIKEVNYFKDEIPTLKPCAKKARASEIYSLKDQLDFYLEKSNKFKEKSLKTRKTLKIILSNLFEKQLMHISTMKKDIETIIDQDQQHLKRDPLWSVKFVSDEYLFEALESGLDFYCSSDSCNSPDLSLKIKNLGQCNFNQDNRPMR